MSPGRPAPAKWRLPTCLSCSSLLDDFQEERRHMPCGAWGLDTPELLSTQDKEATRQASSCPSANCSVT